MVRSLRPVCADVFCILTNLLWDVQSNTLQGLLATNLSSNYVVALFFDTDIDNLMSSALVTLLTGIFHHYHWNCLFLNLVFCINLF